MSFEDSVCTHGIGFEEHAIASLCQQSDSFWVAEAKTTQNPTDDSATKHAAAVALARTRARAVLEKFQKQRSLIGDPSKSRNSATIGEETLRRQRWLACERNRLQQARFKNLDSLLKLDKAKLARMDSKVSSAVDVEQATSNHYDSLLERRRTKLLGLHVSTHQPKKQSTQPSDHQIQSSTTTSFPNNGAAVYVSGLRESDTEEVLRSLFGAFGQVKRIHFYREKATNVLKGDGLVIYDVSKVQRPQILLQSVCGQLNGSELPQGNVLRVETSRTNQFAESETIPEPVCLPNAATEGDPGNNDAVSPKPDTGIEADPELDDFFDSI